MSVRRRLTVIAIIAIGGFGAKFWFGSERHYVTVLPVYRICGACGLDVAEVDQLIDDMKNSTLSREDSLELYRSTFERREDAELCGGCAEAVLDAAVK